MSMYVNYTYTPSVEIKNLGNDVSPSKTIKVIGISGYDTVYSDISEIPPLNPLQSIVINFPSTFVPTSPGTYIFTFAIDTVGDINTSNNTKTAYCGCDFPLETYEKEIPQKGKVTVFDIYGRKVFEGEMAEFNLKRGIYFILTAGKVYKVIRR